MKSFILTLIFLLVMVMPAHALTYYVSTTGNNLNNGTSLSTPWRTLQYTVDHLPAGMTAYAAAGNYGENVSITSSGTAGNLKDLEGTTTAGGVVTDNGASGMTIGSGTAITKHVTISASHWKVRGLEITNSTHAENTLAYGVYVTGSATDVWVNSNVIHDTCQDGVFMDPGVSYVNVSGNAIYHAEMSGINIDGQNDWVQGNDIWDTSQNPANCGSARSGSDADAIRYFGGPHTIKWNILHDIVFGNGSGSNPNPHTDCWQTWGESQRTTTATFDSNWCWWPAIAVCTGSPGGCTDAAAGEESGEIEAANGTVGTITLINNVFANMNQGFNADATEGHGAVGPIIAVNNVWDTIEQEALIFNDQRSSSDKVINNQFLDVGNLGSNGDSYMGCTYNSGASICTTLPTLTTNNYYMRGNAATGTWTADYAHSNFDPGFTTSIDSAFTLSGWTGQWYRYATGSSSLGAGTTNTYSTYDADGNTRNNPPSLGAYGQ